jgi:hypothetical protein
VTVFSDLASKPVATVFFGLASKPVTRVSWVGPQNQQLWFGDLGLKITAMVSWFGPQNQAGFGLLVGPQNRRREDSVGHTSRSAGLLRLEASCARRQVVHVAPSWRSRRDQVEDGRVDATGCVGPCYPYFAIFYVLGPRGIVVF